MVCRPLPTCRLRLSRTSRLPPAGLGAAAVGHRAACREGTFPRLFATKHAEEAETVSRHIKSLLPILPDNEFEQAGKAASRFVEPGGVGEVLQRRLLEHDALEPVRRRCCLPGLVLRDSRLPKMARGDVGP
ncbi:MAG: hypothetical protein BJ554DRAFT_162 [Olpidium bornovanus]|uniref:Choline/carnitine acyltransferase domain-containing protein n=1 Tax=Olpidium bornovanus TaxID=278681 RepID=A0A8H7ZU99_9FUNG|nr:MAG: hypothetical protein BJ554DRAFT_162 [Olpidium bornovanus]